MEKHNHLPIAIIGAGPVGLAAATHLLARGITPLILEAGPKAGSSIEKWAHVKMFSPWQFNVDKEVAKLLLADGWTLPPEHEYPTGRQLLDRFIRPLAELEQIKRHLQLNTRVLAVTRVGQDVMKTLGRFTGQGLVVKAGEQVLPPVDELIVATGFRPDMSLLAELRIALDPATQSAVLLAPMIDPNKHSCGTVQPHGAVELAHPEEGLFIVGMKSYGCAPTFLLMTGYEQVRSVAAALAGDWDAAKRVELVLPETGICNSDFDEADDRLGASERQASCCNVGGAVSDLAPRTSSGRCKG